MNEGRSLAHTSPAASLSGLQGIKNWSRKAKNISFLLPARSLQYYRLGEILTSTPEFLFSFKVAQTYSVTVQSFKELREQNSSLPVSDEFSRGKFKGKSLHTLFVSEVRLTFQ